MEEAGVESTACLEALACDLQSENNVLKAELYSAKEQIKSLTRLQLELQVCVNEPTNMDPIYVVHI